MWNSTGDVTAVSRKSDQVSSQNHFIERYDRKKWGHPMVGPKVAPNPEPKTRVTFSHYDYLVFM